MIKRINLLAFLLAMFLGSQAQDATQIVKKADDKMEGETSNYTEMSMTIERPSYTRTIEFKSWTEGKQNSITYITSPAQEKG